MREFAPTILIIGVLLPNLAEANAFVRCQSGGQCQASACGTTVQVATRTCLQKCPGASVTSVQTNSDCTAALDTPKHLTPVNYLRR
jgi:hypothetical protein